MKSKEIQKHIDRVVGTEGILRIPSWWMHKILSDLVKYCEDNEGASVTIKEYVESQLNLVGKTIEDLDTRLENIESHELFEIVSELPSEPKDNTIYLIPSQNGEGNNVLTEWVHINGTWEQFGEFKANVDLSEYAKKEALDELSAEVNEVAEKIDSVNPAPMISVTYAELKSLRDNGELVAGMQYRITDYVTTTAQENTRSAGHQFDIIVTADSENTLNEVARACRSEFDIEKYKDAFCGSWGEKMLYVGTQEYEGKEYHLYESESRDLQMLVDFNQIKAHHYEQSDPYPYYCFPSFARGNDGSIWEDWQLGNDYGEPIQFKYDTPSYFATSKLEAWQIWYSLDNDAERFAWADNSSADIYDSSNCNIKSDLIDGTSFITPFAFSGYMWNDPINGEDYETKVENDLVYTWAMVNEPNGSRSLTLYKSDKDIYEEEGRADYADKFFYRGVVVIDGEEYDTWQKYEDGNEVGYDIGEGRKAYALTERIVEGEVIHISGSKGKGVIYRMIDEWNNDVPYDFKNIQFKRKITLDMGYPQFSEDAEETWVYTFCANSYHINNEEWSELKDGSLESPYGHMPDENLSTFHHNSIKPWIVYYNVDDIRQECGKAYLNDNVFLGYWEEIGSGNEEDMPYYHADCCWCNTFDNSCFSNSFGYNCYSNSFGYNCYSNSFGEGCSHNSFGKSCAHNSFGKGCSGNTFGNEFYNNTFDSYCNFNTLGSECNNNSFGNNCNSNSLGNRCYGNSFGNGCCGNSFGNSCYSNSLGKDCNFNSFGNDCYSNILRDFCFFHSFGNGCNSNSFGNNCYSNIFGNNCNNNNLSNNCCFNILNDGCGGNSFGNGCCGNSFGNDSCENSFGNGCNNNTFRDGRAYGYDENIDEMVSEDGLINQCQNIHFGDGCKNIILVSKKDSEQWLQNISIAQGLSPTEKVEVEDMGEYDKPVIVEIDVTDQSYEIKVARNSKGELKVYCEADLIA